MDFLPTPQNSSGIILVSDLGGNDYDGKSFEDYGLRCGWDVHKLRHGDVEGARLNSDALPDSVLQAKQFLQTWLFFGTLSTLLNRTVMRSEYTVLVEEPDGTKKSFITNKNLLSQLADWASTLTSVPRNEQLEQQEILVNSLNLGTLVLRDISEYWKRAHIMVLPEDVHLSLVSHIYMLNYYAYQARPPDVARYANFAATGRCAAFESRLLSQGWCPNLIERLTSMVGIPGLYYASLMESGTSTISHSSCTENLCTANNVDEGHYTIRHHTASCQCENTEAASSDLCSILCHSQIPLVTISGSDDDIYIHILPSENTRKYVAISHVWSDGLGNPKGNSLPRCQLRFLQKCLVGLEGLESDPCRRLLWMDTICVPTTSDAGRAAAILAMRKTYEEAEAVLVLDMDMLSIKAPSHHEEILVRIARSNWMTRLWTLQEAALAPRLFFQFADRAVDFRELRHAVFHEPTYTGADFLGHRAATKLQNVFGITTSKPMQRYSYPLAAVWSSLRWRTTTKARDVAICTATLIGSNVAKVLGTVDEEKMEAFWSSQQTIPSSILWVNGPRLRSSSFRWAPASLLNPETLRGNLRDDCTPATHTTAGLQVYGLPAFWIHNPWIPASERDCFKFFDPRNSQTYNVYKCEHVGNDTWEEVGIHWIKKSALILQDEVRSDSWIPGILVAEYTTFGGIIRTQWLAQVSVFQEGGSYDSIRRNDGSFRSQRRYTQARYQAALDPETGQLQEAWGEFVGLEQKWLVS
jgi:hypothetical protein